ncbi:MAG TPA: hypothetical protein VN541_11635 [Tepidisphaeraceae bacterium]|nr:hypothetical protein [Tepidisphaeraceae bacterium]
MSDGEGFYDWFIKTDALEVSRALANEGYRAPGTLSCDELDLLASNILTMDEGHAANAVVILSHHDPSRLLPVLSRLLADPRADVWCAAEGALLELPKDIVTPEIVNEIRGAVRQRSGDLEDSYTIKWFLNSLAR